MTAPPRELDGASPPFPPLPRRRFLGGVLAALAAPATGCIQSTELEYVAGFTTRLVTSEEPLEPAPPESVYWLRIAELQVPAKNRRGRPWAEVGGPPNAVVVLRIDGEAVFETPETGPTLETTWEPGVASGNFELAPQAELELAVFDRGALNDRPLAEGKLDAPDDTDLSRGFMEVDIGRVGSPGTVRLEVSRARALRGVGFDVEVFGSTVKVSRVIRHSPAGRAGFEVEDEILAVDGVELRKLQPRQLISAMNGFGHHPAQVLVKHAKGTTETFRIAEGPCYALFDELGTIA